LSQGIAQYQRNVPTFFGVKLKIVLLGTPFSSFVAPGIWTFRPSAS